MSNFWLLRAFELETHTIYMHIVLIRNYTDKIVYKQDYRLTTHSICMQYYCFSKGCISTSFVGLTCALKLWLPLLRGTLGCTTSCWQIYLSHHSKIFSCRSNASSSSNHNFYLQHSIDHWSITVGMLLLCSIIKVFWIFV